MTLDQFLRSKGLHSVPGPCAEFAQIEGVAAALAATVEKFTLDNLALATAATGSKITAAHYFVAELLTEGVKQDMAAMLGVSTQALWRYEKRHDGLLRIMRPEFNTQFRLSLLKHQRKS